MERVLIQAVIDKTAIVKTKTNICFNANGKKNTMAMIRNPTEQGSWYNYVAGVGLLACMSCLVLMLKFRGFKASLNLYAKRKQDKENEVMLVSMQGAYRINRDEFYGNDRISEPPKKLTPSMVKLPPSIQPTPPIRSTKSTSDLTAPKNLPPQLNRSSQDVSLDPRGGTSSNRNSAVEEERKPIRKDVSQDKDQQKLEKKRWLAEQKAREKAQAQEKNRQEKIRKEREKQAAREQARLQKESKKKKAPAPPPQLNNPLAANRSTSYNTNTLESSIGKSSGPPPYSEVPKSSPSVVDSSPSNVTFSKPINNEPDSWDMISQHRQQINRPNTTAPQKDRRKNMVMDLQYNLGSNDKDNSEA